jgi:uncharacterized protein YukE
MPIITTIEGNPDELRRAADWLRGGLSAGMQSAADRAHRVRRHAEAGWTGAASDAFQARMHTVGSAGDHLVQGVDRLAGVLDSYADALHTAQAGVRRARRIAADGGIPVTATMIADPPDQVSVANYVAAREEVECARRALRTAADIAKAALTVLIGNRYLTAAEFVTGYGKPLAEAHVRGLESRARLLLKEVEVQEDLYRRSLAGTPERLRGGATVAQRMAAYEAQELAKNTKIRTLGRGLRIGGPLLAPVGVGWDIHQGTPPGKAIFSGIGGLVAGTTAEALLTVVGCPPIVSVPVSIGIGNVTSAWNGYVYEHVVPDNIQRKIDNGLRGVAHFAGKLLS